MTVVNFVLGDFSSLRVGCSPDGSTLDVGTPKADGPCFAPVISPKYWLMFGVRPNSLKTTMSVFSSKPLDAKSETRVANGPSNSPSCSKWKLKFSLWVS